MAVSRCAFGLFCVITSLLIYAYGGFNFLLGLLTRLGRSRLLRDESFEPTVTIFIPAYNEEKVIAAKIENCRFIDYPQEKIEIMVCSDCSSDRTVEIARTCGQRGITVFDYRERAGKTGLINKFLPQAKGEIIVMTDANTMLSPDALRRMISCYYSKEIGGVLGYVKLSMPSGGRGMEQEISYRKFEAQLKYKEGLFGSAIGGFGGFYSLRKECFTPLPHNAYSNDDLLIPMRILGKGWKVVFDPLAVSKEETGITVSKEFRRRVRIGAGNFQAFFLLLRFLKPLRGWPFLFYVSHKVLRWFSPFLLLLFFLTNIVLATKTEPLFETICLLQCLFYGAALCGAVLSRFRITIPLISAIYLFVSMNIALCFGFFRYFRGIKTAAWESTPRNQV
jgi:cellulose synthase/poly-beta-1,6-N-acetylglucosamine synthase-like glycosyltransferase